MKRVIPVVVIGGMVMGGALLVDGKPTSVPAPIPVAAADPAPVNTALTLAGFDATVDQEVPIDDQAVQITAVDLHTGERDSTDNETAQRAALSIAKIYIAQYVFENGSAAEQSLAEAMVKDSDDWAAAQLYQVYPGSIDAIAEKYDLASTSGGWDWGFSMTSSYDVAYFLAQLLMKDPEGPLLTALRAAEDYAADGTAQNFGTAVLPGVEGTKWGWSDDGTLHASVSFGTDFVVAAFVTGSADDLTTVVEDHLGQ